MNALEQHSVIGRVLNFKKKGKRSLPWETKTELPATRILMRQLTRLYQVKDGLLYRKTGSYSHKLELPWKLHSVIIKELQRERGHLSAPFGPETNMENDVVHFVTKVYPCLKQR